jgi:AraC-like DNA-binding protein
MHKISSFHGPLVFQSSISVWSADQKIPIIPGGRAFSAEDDFVRVISQEYERPQYTLSLTAYHAKLDTRMQIEQEDPSLLLRVTLKNHVKYKCETGCVHLKMGQFMLASRPSINDFFDIKKEQDYLVFEMKTDIPFLKELKLRNKLLNNLLKKTGPGKVARLLSYPANSGALSLFAIRELLVNPGDKKNVKQVIEEILNAAVKGNGHAIPMRKIDLMFKASCLIEKNIKKIKEDIEEKKENVEIPFTNAKLVSAAGTNKRDLKVLFKAIFLMPPGEYANHVQIRTARLLLINNPELSVNEIARMVGYSGSIALGPRFKKITGMTPIEFRRRYGIV